MAHGITCTQLSGKETKNGNGKGDPPGWPPKGGKKFGKCEGHPHTIH